MFLHPPPPHISPHPPPPHTSPLPPHTSVYKEMCVSEAHQWTTSTRATQGELWRETECLTLSTFSVDSSVSPHSSHSVNSIPFLWSPLTSLHLPLLSASNLSLNFISSLSDDVHLFKTPLGHHFKSSVILTSFLSRPQTNGQVHDVVYCILCCYFSYCLVCVCIVNHVVQVTVCFELTAMEICSWIPAPRRKVRIWRQLLWNTCAHSALCTLHVEQSWQWIRQATGGLAGNIFTYACYKLFFKSTAKIHNEPGHILTCICSLPGALLGGGSMECFVNNLCLACGRTMRFSWKRWSSYQLIVKLFDFRYLAWQEIARDDSRQQPDIQ